jgi:two-component system sensor histidine kinase RegB
MDAPLLALTLRRRANAPNGLAPETAAAENMRQLSQLRWIAVAGQTLTIVFVHFVLGVALPLFQMLSVVLVLAAANFAARAALPHYRVHDVEVLAALLLDTGALTLQLYYSGGATNPFISLYLLQVVLGAILLPRRSVWVLVAATCFCYALLSVRHVPLVLPPTLLADSADLYTIGNWIGFAMVGTLLVPFVTRISRNLSARDAYLAGLRQQAAEEDGIIRMGLFASGAAHELGTPLSSISVILADWRRMPRISGDPELAAEVADMQSEVQRCKLIVSDILHSAGEPRGEAMASTPARAFLEVLAEEWQVAHPHVPLAFRAALPPDATIPTDPSLRQAVWNLLDNAGEASATHVALDAGIEGEALAISVSDHGPGFPADQLPSIGKLYQSSKGAGHGLGLFLAVNVARRLGGRLEASNRDSGAQVRLVLPLLPTAQGKG